MTKAKRLFHNPITHKTEFLFALTDTIWKTVMFFSAGKRSPENLTF